MSRNSKSNNTFSEIQFSTKVNKTYKEWFSTMFKSNFDGKFINSFTNLDCYKRGQGFLKPFKLMIVCVFWFLHLFVFPITALIFKLYWSKQYRKTVDKGEDPLSDIIVSSVSNPIYNGLRVFKILEEHSTGTDKTYKLLLENKEIVNFSDSELIFKSTLLIKKEKLEKELKNIDYLLQSFDKNDTEKDL